MYPRRDNRKLPERHPQRPAEAVCMYHRDERPRPAESAGGGFPQRRYLLVHYPAYALQIYQTDERVRYHKHVYVYLQSRTAFLL